jgi:hypothetical protein
VHPFLLVLRAFYVSSGDIPFRPCYTAVQVFQICFAPRIGISVLKMVLLNKVFNFCARDGLKFYAFRKKIVRVLLQKLPRLKMVCNTFPFRKLMLDVIFTAKVVNT